MERPRQSRHTPLGLAQMQTFPCSMRVCSLGCSQRWCLWDLPRRQCCPHPTKPDWTGPSWCPTSGRPTTRRDTVPWRTSCVTIPSASRSGQMVPCTSSSPRPLPHLRPRHPQRRLLRRTSAAFPLVDLQRWRRQRPGGRRCGARARVRSSDRGGGRTPLGRKRGGGEREGEGGEGWGGEGRRGEEQGAAPREGGHRQTKARAPGPPEGRG